MKNFKFKDLLNSITTEHYKLSYGNDTSIGYLWYMYHQGINAGKYRPFIFMAEMQLLKTMGYLTEKEIKNLLGMLSSEDEDNLYIAALTLDTLRKQRIKDHGEYNGELNKSYEHIASNYTDMILSHDVFVRNYSHSNV
jgi:hypothetical protein